MEWFEKLAIFGKKKEEPTLIEHAKTIKSWDAGKIEKGFMGGPPGEVGDAYTAVSINGNKNHPMSNKDLIKAHKTGTAKFNSASNSETGLYGRALPLVNRRRVKRGEPKLNSVEDVYKEQAKSSQWADSVLVNRSQYAKNNIKTSIPPIVEDKKVAAIPVDHKVKNTSTTAATPVNYKNMKVETPEAASVGTTGVNIAIR